MKTFRWDWVTLVGSTEQYLWLSERDGNIGKVWASIIKIDKYFYRCIVINKDRNQRLTIEEPLILKDAKEAILKKLFDDEVIKDQDILEDYDETP